MKPFLENPLAKQQLDALFVNEKRVMSSNRWNNNNWSWFFPVQVFFSNVILNLGKTYGGCVSRT